jgi:hypothetical protein
MYSPRNLPSDARDYITYLGGRSERKVAHNTWVRQYNDPVHGHTINITYHNTVIASFYGDMMLVTDGGFRTKTTKCRINAILGRRARIHSEYYVWYITHDGMKYPWAGYSVLLQ